MPFVNVTKKDLEKINLAQDIPTLLKNLPSVVTTSDSGSGIGYSSIMIRGSDQTRVNVTINGVPYNDSESMMSYWVNLPDLSSSIESIQVQRGVGTSTNGSAAFGGSINILTNAASDKASFEINNTLGSFNTVKNSVGFSTGFINDNFELSGYEWQDDFLPEVEGFDWVIHLGAISATTETDVDTEVFTYSYSNVPGDTWLLTKLANKEIIVDLSTNYSGSTVTTTNPSGGSSYSNTSTSSYTASGSFTATQE